MRGGRTRLCPALGLALILVRRAETLRQEKGDDENRSQEHHVTAYCRKSMPTRSGDLADTWTVMRR